MINLRWFKRRNAEVGLDAALQDLGGSSPTGYKRLVMPSVAAAVLAALVGGNVIQYRNGQVVKTELATSQDDLTKSKGDYTKLKGQYDPLKKEFDALQKKLKEIEDAAAPKVSYQNKTHKVKAGDTLSKIVLGSNFGVRSLPRLVNDAAKYNKIANVNSVFDADTQIKLIYNLDDKGIEVRTKQAYSGETFGDAVRRLFNNQVNYVAGLNGLTTDNRARMKRADVVQYNLDNPANPIETVGDASPDSEYATVKRRDGIIGDALSIDQNLKLDSYQRVNAPQSKPSPAVKLQGSSSNANSKSVIAYLPSRASNDATRLAEARHQELSVNQGVSSLDRIISLYARPHNSTSEVPIISRASDSLMKMYG